MERPSSFSLPTASQTPWMIAWTRRNTLNGCRRRERRLHAASVSPVRDPATFHRALFAAALFRGCLFFRRNDRQQQVGRFAAGKMQAAGAAKDGGGSVARIVVQERTAAGQFVLEVRQLAAAAAAIFVILAADRYGHAMAGRHHDRAWPNLDVELRHLALLERLLLVVRVIGPVGRRQFLVELAVRGAQPALCDRRVRIDRALEYDFLQIAGEYPQHDEEIGVGGRGGGEQLERRRAGDLGLLRQRRGQEGEAVAHGGEFELCRLGRLL